MCDAKRIGDQMMCGRCGIQWDHDDPDGDSCCPAKRPSLPLSMSSPDTVEKFNERYSLKPTEPVNRA